MAAILPQSISLVLRAIKGTGLTNTEIDTNFTNLRTAILGIAGLLSGGRVVVGAEPPAGQRTKVVWIPSTYDAIYTWNADISDWVRLKEPKLYAVATGSADAYVVTMASPDFNLVTDLTGVPLFVEINFTNSGADVTLKVNAFDEKNVRKNGPSQLVAGDLVDGQVALFVYDGTQFQLLNPASSIADAVTSIIATKTVVGYSPLKTATASLPATPEATLSRPTGYRWDKIELHLSASMRSDPGVNIGFAFKANSTDGGGSTVWDITTDPDDPNPGQALIGAGTADVYYVGGGSGDGAHFNHYHILQAPEDMRTKDEVTFTAPMAVIAGSLSGDQIAKLLVVATFVKTEASFNEIVFP